MPSLVTASAGAERERESRSNIAAHLAFTLSCSFSFSLALFRSRLRDRGITGRYQHLTCMPHTSLSLSLSVRRTVRVTLIDRFDASNVITIPTPESHAVVLRHHASLILLCCGCLALAALASLETGKQRKRRNRQEAQVSGDRVPTSFPLRRPTQALLPTLAPSLARVQVHSDTR